MDINRPDIHAEVSAVFARYEEALVNNHIDELDALFWANDATVRFGVAESLYGIDAIRAFRAARPPVGLARTLARTVIATAMTEFFRPPSTAIGRQSQTWVRLDGGWRVVAAHVSVIQAAQ
jgi:hypothetical protein